MKLTKKEKQLCIDKWQWFYDHPMKYYQDMPKKIKTELRNYKGYCPLCNKMMNEENICNPSCPVIIKTKKGCMHHKGIYYKWCYSLSKENSKKYAGKLLEIMRSL